MIVVVALVQFVRLPELSTRGRRKTPEKCWKKDGKEFSPYRVHGRNVCRVWHPARARTRIKHLYENRHFFMCVIINIFVDWMAFD